MEVASEGQNKQQVHTFAEIIFADKKKWRRRESLVVSFDHGGR